MWMGGHCRALRFHSGLVFGGLVGWVGLRIVLGLFEKEEPIPISAWGCLETCLIFHPSHPPPKKRETLLTPTNSNQLQPTPPNIPSIQKDQQPPLPFPFPYCKEHPKTGTPLFAPRRSPRGIGSAWSCPPTPWSCSRTPRGPWRRRTWCVASESGRANGWTGRWSAHKCRSGTERSIPCALESM